MKSSSLSTLRAVLPLLLIFSIVLAGFSLIIVRQNNFHSFEQQIDLQIQNITAQKDLGALIVDDLQKVATYFYMILISADQERQQLLLDDVRLIIAEIHAVLNILSDGGNLSRELPLNLPNQNTYSQSITYLLKNQQHYNLEVLTLRPQLVDLEEQLELTIYRTEQRNRLLNKPEGNLLQETALQLRIFAKHIHSQLNRMTENANKLVRDANQEMMLYQDKISAAQGQNKQVELLWAIGTVIAVFGFIGFIYREILASQRKLKNIVLQLQETEQELQESHSSVLELNRSLEEQVAVRTEELQTSERQWIDAFNALDSVIFIHDREGKIIRANDAYLKLAGCSLEEASGQHYWNLFPRQDTPFAGCLEEIKGNGEHSCAQTIDVTIDEIIYRSQSFVINDPQEKYLYSLHLMDDITERQRYVDKLRKYEQILSTDTDLIAFFDQDHIFLAANSVYADYFNVDPEKVVGTHAKEIIGAERYQNYLKYQDIVFAEKKTFHFKIWAEYPKMGKRHVETTFTPYVEDDGRVSGFVSRTKDITEISEQETRLQLSAKVFESTSEGIMVTDQNGKVLVVNSAFRHITGYSEIEIIGKNPRILQSGRHDKSFYQTMWQELGETGQWRGEIWNKRKNGEIYSEFLVISSMKDDADETINYIAVFSDITPIKQAQEQLKYQAHHHPLTGLPNRLLLFARLEHSIQHVKREREHGAVMFLDLDNFKKVNDSLGHNAGDEVLKGVASRLRKHTRDVDTVSHFGGDEFVIVLQTIRTVHDATVRAQKILDSLQQPFVIDGYELYVSGSIGIAEFTGENEDIENLLKNADAAMYKAKESGKNRYQLYSPELTNIAIEKVLLESHLRRAVERNELVLYYQPQVTLPAGNIVAVEALVRWQHPDLGLVSPDKFIPLSEETGLIVEIGEWVLRTACEQLMLWRKQGCGLRRIAVNLSGKQIQQKNLPEMVERVLLETGCPSGSLELEITEGFIMQHPEKSISALQQIRALGVELSVDDFGTGHSSLNYLKKLPINRLKIDRSFVWDIGENPEGEAITKAVIAMGKSLNLQITGEGIETPTQRQFLESHGCHEAQGYLFSRPLPAEEVGDLIKRGVLGSDS
ncbi:MAG: EAL domain-containing protein [Desulfuromusa sp.]|nr:EAL domain-containing protein [Desulfuromusa sp.]